MTDITSSKSQAPYRLNRDALSSCRLNLQSNLWRESLDYVVHPDVKLPAKNACIADVGTGTGRWLVDLEQDLKQRDMQLDGLDINISQCPPQSWLENSAVFREWDAFAPPPDDLLGKYDLVHVRLFQINLKDKVDIFIDHLKSILKPGGYLQWEEYDSQDLPILKSRPDCKTAALEMCAKYITESSQRHEGLQDWLAHLPALLNRSGFDEAVSYRHIDPPRLARYCFENWIMTLTEFTNAALKGTEEGVNNMVMLEAAYEECLGGAVIILGKRICVARRSQN